MLSPQEQDDYFRQPAVWKEIQEVFDFHLKAYPEDLDARSWLAWYASEAGQNETAIKELTIIGDRWTRSPWETKERYE
jgi:thioredoxin-like negative regulator of GroEL